MTDLVRRALAMLHRVKGSSDPLPELDRLADSLSWHVFEIMLSDGVDLDAAEEVAFDLHDTGLDFLAITSGGQTWLEALALATTEAEALDDVVRRLSDVGISFEGIRPARVL